MRGELGTKASVASSGSIAVPSPAAASASDGTEAAYRRRPQWCANHLRQELERSEGSPRELFAHALGLQASLMDPSKTSLEAPAVKSREIENSWSGESGRYDQRQACWERRRAINRLTGVAEVAARAAEYDRPARDVYMLVTKALAAL